MVTSAIKKNSAEKGNEAGEQVAFFSFFLVVSHGMWNFPNQGWKPIPLAVEAES